MKGKRRTITIRTRHPANPHPEVLATVYGDWAVHPILMQYDDGHTTEDADMSAITHVPSGLRLVSLWHKDRRLHALARWMADHAHVYLTADPVTEPGAFTAQTPALMAAARQANVAPDSWHVRLGYAPIADAAASVRLDGETQEVKLG